MSSKEQMLMENKLTYTGVVQRTEPSAPSLISLTLSCLCLTRPFYLTVLPTRGEMGWTRRSWTLLTYACADSGLFLPAYPSPSITVTLGQKQSMWSERTLNVIGFFFSVLIFPISNDQLSSSDKNGDLHSIATWD